METRHEGWLVFWCGLVCWMFGVLYMMTYRFVVLYIMAYRFLVLYIMACMFVGFVYVWL